MVCSVETMNVTPIAWMAMVSAISDRPQIQLSNVCPPYSEPIRAPFCATERFISSTTKTSATMTTASTQNTSK